MKISLDNQQKIDKEAADWVAKLSSESITNEEKRQFNLWINASPANRAAFFAMHRHWQQINQAMQLSGMPAQPSVRSQRYWMRAAASIVFAVIVAASYYQLQDYLIADYVTIAGGQKTLQLEDGSILHMNTDTALAIDFSPQFRRIRLLHGEAEINVAHAPSRPLVIVSGHYEAMALGTDFSVANINNHHTVTVFESTVQVNDGKEVLDVLKPGQQLAIDGNHKRQQKFTVNLEEAHAWREGKLVFTDRPLQSVVDEINRYRPGHLFLLDKSAANRPVSGVFHIKQLDTSLLAIAEILALKPLQINGYVVALY